MKAAAAEPQVRRVRGWRRPDPVLPHPRPLADRERVRLRRPVRPERVLGALASSDLLTDDPYLDTRPIPASGRQLFIPDLVGGRLVETPGRDHRRGDEIRDLERHARAARPRSSPATTSSPTAASSCRAGSPRSSARERADADQRHLVEERSCSGRAARSRSAAPLRSTTGTATTTTTRRCAADGDQTNLLSTADLTGTNALSGGIFFTMGCHAGFQTTDAIVGSSAADKLDWAETSPAPAPVRRQHRLRARQHRQRRVLRGADGRPRRSPRRLALDRRGARAREAGLLPLPRRVQLVRREDARRGGAVRPADVRRRPRAERRHGAPPPCRPTRCSARPARRARAKARWPRSRARAPSRRTSRSSRPSAPSVGPARLLVHERRPGPGAELPAAAAVRDAARHPERAHRARRPDRRPRQHRPLPVQPRQRAADARPDGQRARAAVHRGGVADQGADARHPSTTRTASARAST